MDEPTAEPAHDAQPSSPQAEAPPTIVGELRAPSATGWPVAVGVISIIFGAGGVAMTPLSILLIALVSPAEAPPGQTAYSIVNGVVSVALSGWLLGAGIGVVRRRAWGVRHLRWWSFAKMVFTVVSMAVGYTIQALDGFSSFGQAGGAAGPPTTALIVVAVISGVLGFVWLLAWPVFCLIWLRRPLVRDQFRQWVQPNPSLTR